MGKTKEKEKEEESMEEKNSMEKKNPLHREYGLLSNICFIVKSMIASDRRFLFLIPLGMVCATLMQYLWTFISKFVIDMITGEGEIRQLFFLMLAVTVFQIVSTMANTYYYEEIWWRWIYARFSLIGMKNRKVMTIDFEHLENPDVMDCYQKAGNACNGNNEGVEGMMREISDFLISLFIVAIGICILGTMNGYVLLVMITAAFLNFLMNNHTNKTLKKIVWDPLASWWRKDYYMQNTTTDAAWAKDIRMFNLKDWLVDKYKELKKIRLKAQKTNARYWMRVWNVAAFLWGISQIFVYGWLIRAAAAGEVTIGNFSLYIASAGTFFEYMSRMLNGVSSLLARSREVDDFRSFMDFDGGDREDTGGDVPESERYEFEFRNVSFRYPKAEKYALRNMNLTVRAGERLAVVGLNGAGKSTFIKLLLRLYEPTEGEILLNGVNVKEYNKRSYYALFAPVFQDVELFAFPLAENVSMKAPEETDKKRAENTLVQAGLAEKIKELPKGIDTEILKVIYDDGVDLSGGEKQKLALARALYKNAPVVVLDEPTAALDALAESKLYADFDKLIGGKTAVYISHRLSSTQFCQHVAMFQDGKLEEYGTHEQLLSQNGSYAKMFRIQAQYYVENPESGVAQA